MDEGYDVVKVAQRYFDFIVGKAPDETPPNA